MEASKTHRRFTRQSLTSSLRAQCDDAPTNRDILIYKALPATQPPTGSGHEIRGLGQCVPSEPTGDSRTFTVWTAGRHGSARCESSRELDRGRTTHYAYRAPW